MNTEPLTTEQRADFTMEFLSGWDALTDSAPLPAEWSCAIDDLHRAGMTPGDLREHLVWALFQGEETWLAFVADAWRKLDEGDSSPDDYAAPQNAS